MGCKSSAVSPPFPPTAIFPVALLVSHYRLYPFIYIGIDERRCKCTVNLSSLRTRCLWSGLTLRQLKCCKCIPLK